MMSPYLMYTLLYLSWLLNEERGRGGGRSQERAWLLHTSSSEDEVACKLHTDTRLWIRTQEQSTHKSTSKRCKWLEMQILTSLQVFFAKPEIRLDRL